MEKVKKLPATVDTLVLESDGGKMIGAFDAALVISSHDLTTYVPNFCHSACTMLFQSGKRRIIAPGALMTYHTSNSKSSKFDIYVGNIFARYGLDRSFVDKMLANRRVDYDLTAEEVLAIGGATEIGELVNITTNMQE